MATKYELFFFCFVLGTARFCRSPPPTERPLHAMIQKIHTTHVNFVHVPNGIHSFVVVVHNSTECMSKRCCLKPRKQRVSRNARG